MRMRSQFLIFVFTMNPPQPNGVFHAVMAAGAVCAVLIGWRLRNLSEAQKQKLLWRMGWVLLLAELAKQLFRFLIVDQGVYNWWYFPFQLCSVPMYLCLLLPMVKKGRRTIITFLADFALLGGAAVYLDPSDMLSPYVFLTLFSFLWHDLLIVIAIVCGTSESMQDNAAGAVKMLGLFGALCGIAEILNLVLSRYGELSMFYLSPKMANTQLVFRDIAQIWGTAAGNFSYFLAMIGGGLLMHRLWRKIRRKRHEESARDV